MASTRHPDGVTEIQTIADRRRSLELRRQALENLQRLAGQLEAASILDHRADRSNPTLAAVLRERAEERRQIAAVIRDHLDRSQARSAGTSSAATSSGWSLRKRYQ